MFMALAAALVYAKARGRVMSFTAWAVLSAVELTALNGALWFCMSLIADLYTPWLPLPVLLRRVLVAPPGAAATGATDVVHGVLAGVVIVTWTAGMRTLHSVATRFPRRPPTAVPGGPQALAAAVAAVHALPFDPDTQWREALSRVAEQAFPPPQRQAQANAAYSRYRVLPLQWHTPVTASAHDMAWGCTEDEARVIALLLSSDGCAACGGALRDVYLCVVSLSALSPLRPSFLYYLYGGSTLGLLRTIKSVAQGVLLLLLLPVCLHRFVRAPLLRWLLLRVVPPRDVREGVSDTPPRDTTAVASS